MINNQNMTVEQIIQESVKEIKLSSQRERRNWVRRMLNYYGGNKTGDYIRNIYSRGKS